jgi:hypothetical protein
MKAATVSEIKHELQHLPKEQLMALCLRLARFKKENKELLTFLLFEAGDMVAYIQSIKLEMDAQFAAINTASVYFVKKSLRKIIRIAAKYIRYSGSAAAEAELLLHFCMQTKSMSEAIKGNPVTIKIYQQQLKKIATAIATMHEDLQYDYQKQLQMLQHI